MCLSAGDPPYGVRAGAKKSVAKPEREIRDRATYIPSTDPYTLGECLRDLLDFSAKMLKVPCASCIALVVVISCHTREVGRV